MFPISPQSSHLYLIASLVQSIVLSENFLDFRKKASNLMIFRISHDSMARNSNFTKMFFINVLTPINILSMCQSRPEIFLDVDIDVSTLSLSQCYIAQIWVEMFQFKILTQSTVLKVWRWMVDTETNLRTSRIKTEKHANFRLTINIWNTNFHCLSCANTKDYKPRQ